MDVGRIGGVTRAQPVTSAPEAQKARKAAEEFEQVMLAHAFETMMKGVKTPGLAGGSSADAMWRSFLVQEQAKGAVKAGGIGIADQVYRELTGKTNGAGR